MRSLAIKMFEDMKDKDPKKSGGDKNKGKPQEILPGQTAQTHKARTFVAPTPEELEAELRRRKRARKIAIHKYFIIFLIGMVLALGYKIVHIFQEQMGTLDKEHDRAYVMPKMPEAVGIPIDLPFTITVPIVNTGNTPAFGVTVKMKTRVVKYTLSTVGGLKTEEGPERVYTSKSVVIKGGAEDDEIASIRLSSVDPIANDFDLMRTKKGIALFVNGTVTYHDSFNANHFSDFCVGYKSDGKGNVDTFDCPSHHDAD